jgi:hypothetical protein
MQAWKSRFELECARCRLGNPDSSLDVADASLEIQIQAWMCQMQAWKFRFRLGCGGSRLGNPDSGLNPPLQARSDSPGS